MTQFLPTYDDHASPNHVDRLVGASIRQRREALKLRVSDLAARLGLCELDIQRIESGRRRLQASLVYRTAMALETSVGGLLPALD